METYCHHSGLIPYQDEFFRCPNYALKMRYFIPFKTFENGNLKKIIEAWPKQYGLDKKNDYFKPVCDHITKSRQALLSSLEMSGHTVSTFSMDTAWRFLPGFGSAHIHETSLNLDHVYGVPYLNGSGCKGIARQYAIEQFERDLIDKTKDSSIMNLSCLENLMETDWKKLEKSLNDKDKNQLKSISSKGGDGCLPDQVCDLIVTEKPFQEKLIGLRTIFGNKEQKGSVMFLDAYPQTLNISLCIMNPHYNKYYDNGANWPVDQLSNPIVHFLSVEENSTFVFALAAQSSGNGTKSLKDARSYLENALINNGAGAKTQVNYGYFDNCDDRTKLIWRETQKRQESAMTPEQKIMTGLDSTHAQTFIQAVIDINNQTEKFSTEEIKASLEKAYEWINNQPDMFNSAQNDAFDKVVIEKILSGITDSKARETFAQKLFNLNRIKSSEYADQVKKYLPARDNDKVVKNILEGLKGRLSNNLINEAKNKLSDILISLEDKLKIATAILKISSSDKTINKALQKAKEAARKIEG